MEKKLLVVLVVVGLCSTVALALDPMGPPTAGLKKGQWSAGIDYSYSDMDLKVENGKMSYSGVEYPDGPYAGTDKMGSAKVKGIKANKIYANIGYGIVDNWDAFVRLGGANAKFDSSGGDLDIKFDSDYVFAYGFGTRVTLWQDADLKVGGLFQMSWANGLNDVEHYSDVTGSEGSMIFDTGSNSAKVDITEYQIAVGPTWTPSKGFSIYGGPFLHFVTGKVDLKYTETYGNIGTENGWTEKGKGSADITEDSYFGGYIGVQIELGENAFVSGEWMTTGDAEAFGLGVVCKFK